MTLSINQIKTILTDHNIESYVETSQWLQKEPDDRILAKEVWVDSNGDYGYKWVEAPTTLKTLKEWLGY